MPSTEHAYIARRIDENDPQNMGMYSIYRRKTGAVYHFNPRNQRLINRNSLAMPTITRGSMIWEGCMKAIQRLVDADTDSPNVPSTGSRGMGGDLR